MAIHVDAGKLSRVTDFVFKTPDGGYLIRDTRKVVSANDGRIQKLHTREMKLETLGIFPLPTAALPLLKESVTFEGEKLEVSPLFLRSQIPVFARGIFAYIPPEGANICRYFFDLWRLPEEIDETPEDVADADAEVIQGFAILASYAGI